MDSVCKVEGWDSKLGSSVSRIRLSRLGLARAYEGSGFMLRDQGVAFSGCRGTSLISNRLLLGPQRRPQGPMVVLGGGAFSYERVTPVWRVSHLGLASVDDVHDSRPPRRFVAQKLFDLLPPWALVLVLFWGRGSGFRS